MARTRWGVSLAAAVVVASGLLTAPAHLAAQTAQVLSPGQVASLSEPGVPMKAFPDGRVNTYGAGVDVAGVSFSTVAGTGSETVTAAPGAVLVVLHIVSQFDPELAPWDDDSTADRGPYQLVVNAGKVSADLFPQGTSGNLDNYVVAAIPDSTPATLTVSDNGLLPQTLDLSTGKRVGASPQALYRDEIKPVVVVYPSASQGFTGTTAAGQQVTGQFAVKVAMLSYWQPYSTTLAPSPDQAYLMLSIGPADLSVLGNSLTVPPIPASDVTVTLPDGTTTATQYNPGASQGNDLFDGLYWAQVPADVPSVKVTVNLPAASPMTAGAYQSGPQTLNISFANPVSTELTLPAAWTPPGQQFSIAHGPTAVHLGKRGGFSWATLLIPIALIALASGLILDRRRRRWLPAREVAWPPKALPPATTALLLRAPPLALPPGQPASAGPGPQPPPPADMPEPATAGPMLVIRLVGDLEADGLCRAIRAEPQRRLLVCLALSLARPLTAEEVARGISDNPDADPQTGSVHSYASRLRRALPEDVFPDARSGRYHLDPDKVVVDWTALDTVASEPPDQPGWTDRAIAALELVRGEPLGGRVWEGVAPLVRTMQTRVEHIAKTLGARLIAAGDPSAAEQAIARGLLGSPQSIDLWGSRLEAATAGSGYGLERAWAEARGVLKADAALLFPTYQQCKRSLGQEAAPSPDPI